MRINNKYYYTDKSSTWELVRTNIVKKETVYQYRRTYVRENKSNECPTLTANMGHGGHNVPFIITNGRVRKLTERECLNIQGFDKQFLFPESTATGIKYAMIGNSVSPPVSKLIATRVLSLLRENHV